MHVFNLFTTHEDAVLYAVFNKVIGHQFFKNLLGLPSIGIHNTLFLSYWHFSTIKSMVSLSCQECSTLILKDFRKLSGKPSDPGLFIILHLVKGTKTVRALIFASNIITVILGEFWCFQFNWSKVNIFCVLMLIQVWAEMMNLIYDIMLVS